MSISDRLDKAMKLARIPSQAALSRASGVPQPTINRILKGPGKRGPETTTLRQLADACGVRFDWLASGVGQMELGSDARAAEDRTVVILDANIIAEAAKIAPRGGPLPPEMLLAFGSISEREAQLLSWFRMATPEGKGYIETVAREAPRKRHLAVVDDQPQSRPLGVIEGKGK